MRFQSSPVEVPAAARGSGSPRRRGRNSTSSGSTNCASRIASLVGNIPRLSLCGPWGSRSAAADAHRCARGGEFQSSSHAQTVTRLHCFHGIDALTHAGLCAEVGDFTRFEKPALLSGFFGVVPSEYTSGEKRTQGHIARAGSTTHQAVAGRGRPQPPSPASGRREPRRHAKRARILVSLQITWRCQRRLHQRWMHLASKRGKPRGDRSGGAAHASSRRSVGRPPPWTETANMHFHGAPAAAGAPRATSRKAVTSPFHGPANRGYGQPAFHLKSGRRPTPRMQARRRTRVLR